MKTICSVCKVLLKDGTISEGISHGLCLPCKDNYMKELKRLQNQKKTPSLVELRNQQRKECCNVTTE